MSHVTHEVSHVTEYHYFENIFFFSCVQLDVASAIKVLCQLLEHAEFQTRIASLRWFCHLLNKVPKKVGKQCFSFVVCLFHIKHNKMEKVFSSRR